jgi:hypothetical protein
MAYLPARNGVTFSRAFYQRIGQASAERRRIERVLFGTDAATLKRRQAKVDALLFGKRAA